jgi:hypothetical protein
MIKDMGAKDNKEDNSFTNYMKKDSGTNLRLKS